MAAGADRGGTGRHLRRLSVHGQRPQRGRLVATARVRSRCLGWHAARRVLAERSRLGAARVSLGRHSSRRLRLAARSDAAFGTLFDGFRIDHLIGFYRTFVRRTDGSEGFVPADEPEQRAQGEYLLTLFARRGAAIIGEDLGTVPDFMRESLAQRSIPGMKVLRWERMARGRPSVSRRSRLSARHRSRPAGRMTPRRMPNGGTLPSRQNAQAVLALPTLHGAGLDPQAPFSERVRDALLGDVVRRRFESADPADARHLRLARSHQRAGVRERRELDLASAASGEVCRMPARARGLPRRLAVEHGRAQGHNRLNGFVHDEPMHDGHDDLAVYPALRRVHRVIVPIVIARFAV